jgi:putative endonuclease
MPVFYVYILQCRDKNNHLTLYTGSTQDLMQRIDLHQSGIGAKYTRGKDLQLMFFETLMSRSDAMKREYEIKNYSVSKKKKF